MGHRHGFKEPQTFETNHDQFWNHIHPEDPLVHLAGASSGVVENNSFLHPVGNLQTDELRCVHWNPPPRLNDMSSSQIAHVPLNQSDVLSMHESFHSSTTVGTLQVPGNHVHHAPSPNYIPENNAFDLTVGTNGRGQYKRKSPMIPSINETGSTSGYYCPGSSSHGSYVRQNIDAQHSRWDSLAMPPNYSPSVGGESSHRNVRSRSTFELDPDLLSTHRGPNFPSHMGSSRHLAENCNPGELSNQSPTLPLLERNHIHISSSSHGRTIYADSGNLNQDASHFMIGSSTSNIPGQIAGYNHDPGSSRNPAAVVQRFHSTSAQTRGVRTSYPQRSVPTNRVGIPGFQLGQAALLEEGLRSLETENYSNRYPRAHTSAGWRSNDRVRSRSFARSSHDQMTREALIAIGRSSFHGPRGMLDQQRELMLDVDNMSYEELLALGERIGSVSTGLSDDQLLKCLKETVYLTSEQVTMEERCVICLEEYQDMDQLGSLKSCSHEYHVGCIKKWLSMKNLCPICKAPALPDDMKKEKMKAPI